MKPEQPIYGDNCKNKNNKNKSNPNLKDDVNIHMSEVLRIPKYFSPEKKTHLHNQEYNKRKDIKKWRCSESVIQANSSNEFTSGFTLEILKPKDLEMQFKSWKLGDFMTNKPVWQKILKGMEEECEHSTAMRTQEKTNKRTNNQPRRRGYKQRRIRKDSNTKKKSTLAMISE